MGRYQVIMRVQMVRTLISQLHDEQHNQSSRFGDVVQLMDSVAKSAEEDNLTAYTVLCRKVAERLSAVGRMTIPPSSLLFRISDWAATSELYLRRDKSRQFARMLVFQLNDPIWGISISHDDQVALIDQLLH